MGWLDRAKGVMDLLEACRALSGQKLFTLELAGEGDVSEAVRSFIVQSGLGNRVSLLGWLQGDKVGQALARADVFVLPSWSEGLPNAMIEAMAARVAIVVSRVGSIPDVLVDGRDALLVPPRDVGALASALARVIDSWELRVSLADAAFAVAEQQFGVEPAAVALELAIRDATDTAKDSR
jgi:glycosyltransferase involved in cell wall biosynthesis